MRKSCREINILIKFDRRMFFFIKFDLQMFFYQIWPANVCWSNLTGACLTFRSLMAAVTSDFAVDHQTGENAFMSDLWPCLFCTNLSFLSFLLLWFDSSDIQKYIDQCSEKGLRSHRKDWDPPETTGTLRPKQPKDCGPSENGLSRTGLRPVRMVKMV